jgi:hypothetical protein
LERISLILLGRVENQYGEKDINVQTRKWWGIIGLHCSSPLQILDGAAEGNSFIRDGGDDEA